MGADTSTNNPEAGQARYITTRNVPLDELTPYPGNAKHGDTEAILTSLRRNAQYRALVVREILNGPLIVLAGNHTLAALTKHGPGPCDWTHTTGTGHTHPCGICQNQPWQPTVRCELIHCDDATARRINLADNRTSQLGGWDFDALTELLAGLDGDFEGTGYTEIEIERLTNTELPEGFTAYDESIADNHDSTETHTCPACGHTFKPQ